MSSNATSTNPVGQPSNPAAPAWQSRAVLLMVFPAAAVYASLHLVALHLRDVPSLRTAEAGAAYSLVFAGLVYASGSATVPAALLGALLAFCYALMPGAIHSPLWPLTLTVLLTLCATRIGKRKKQALHPAEQHSRRTAAQVAANLGVGALAGALIDSQGMVLAELAFIAALAEASADTLASELGQLSNRAPRLLLTGRRVPPGTDGAITASGTAAGILGAAVVALACRWSCHLPWGLAAVGGGGAVFGLFFDSMLGQLLERRGLLNNDAVNFLSTLAAAAFALALGHHLLRVR